MGAILEAGIVPLNRGQADEIVLFKQHAAVDRVGAIPSNAERLGDIPLGEVGKAPFKER